MTTLDATGKRRHRWYLLLAIALPIVAISMVLFWAWPYAPPPLASPPRDESVLADWPHLRGPNYDAISTEIGLANSWPAEGPPVLWVRELGQGYSGIVVKGSQVFTQMQTLGGQFVVCVDAETGAERWRYRYGWPWQPAGRYPGPYATPTWYADKLYYAGPDGLVGCLDAATGRSLWSVNVLRRFAGQGAEFGYACTPLVEDGKVILPVGGPGASLVALSAEDGSTVWQSGDEPGSYAPALPITIAGQRWVFAFLRNSMVAVDLKTGQPRWREEVSTSYDEHSAWPLQAGNYLVVASPFRQGSQCFQLDPAAKNPARSCWTTRALSNDVCSSVLVDSFIYGFDLHDLQANTHRTSRGRFTCLELKTGKVRWATDRVGHSTVLAADGKLILLNDTGTLMLARQSPDRYAELARTKVLSGMPCWTPPTLCRGRLFVRDQQRVVCLYLGDPDRLSAQQRQSASTNSLPAGGGWDWSKVVLVEPDYPNDLPTWGEFRLWFSCGLVVFGLSALLAGLTAFFSRKAARIVFWCAALIVGIVGTTVVGQLAKTFTLTWPAALFTALQVVVLVIHWAERQPVPQRTKARRWSRLMGLLFLGVCLGYFELCKGVGLATGWTFLLGFVPAYPLAVLVAREHHRSLWRTAAWLTLAFAVYYWSSVFFIVWKSQGSG